MTTNATAPKQSLSRRISDGVLNLDYGDEQERMRYYEAYAIVVHCQMILLPVVAAITLLGFGQPATGPIMIMIAAALLPAAFVSGYLKRYGVRTNAIALSNKNRALMVAYVLGCFALAVAVVVVNSANFYLNLGWVFVLSAAIGMLVILAVSARRARDEQVRS